MNSSRNQLLAPTSSLIEKSWHLLTILIQLRRPVRSSELASISNLESTDLIEFLCRIPGSPLTLTNDHFVTVSESALAAICDFLSGAVAQFMPRLEIRVSDRRKDCVLMYARKRKVGASNGGLLGPGAKRRLFLCSENEEELGRGDGLRIQSSPGKASEQQISVADIMVKDRQSIGMLSMFSNQGVALAPNFNNPNVLPSNFGLRNKDLGSRGDDSEQMCNSRQAIVLHESPTLSGYENDSLDFEENAAISEALATLRPIISKAGTGPAVLDTKKDTPILWMETIGEDSCILAAAPLAVQYEEMPTKDFMNADREAGMLSLDNDILIGHTVGLEENELAFRASHCQNEGTSFSASAFRRVLDESSLTVQAPSKLDSITISLSGEHAAAVKHQTLSLKKQKVTDGIISNVESVGKFKYRMDGNFPIMLQDKKGERGSTTTQELSKTHNISTIKKIRKEDVSRISKSNPESKLLPKVESFVIEEEEGSGGYGTVYRAKRKDDGKIFAVKCPHPNAHAHHVHNEMKMLERFGGRNFVIKYEGSFRNGHSECFVLEHVEHDRPEVLKKEINVFELQWYGYCMFRALASLHKQGIVHRDVKPGNFLFSRKLIKGYLIDFNLASDLHQKFAKNSRSGMTSDRNIDATFTLKSASPTKGRKHGIGGELNNIMKEAGDSRKLELKHMKKKSSKGYRSLLPNVDGSSKFGSQAADSGVTSAKDPTSTRTQSADRLKQPMPYKGRKELINFVHEAMQSPNDKGVSGPTFQRKRVAAPLGKNSGRLMILTPMPLHSGGNAVAGAGAGMFNRGSGKHKREGPCVGTKGFRAPEVLFRSSHQGCKIDVWSAGVTLLYLIIGKTPFGGDPEQNVKEIAKLRGSEDLWETAKVHNRESSFPVDLFDVQTLQPMELRDWCAANTKRAEFLDQVPLSLFDLLERCLTVNPRLRISAEAALMHDFFGPCHESLRKQRLLRRLAGSESGSQTL